MKVASESSSLYCGQSGMHLSPTNKRGTERGMHKVGRHRRSGGGFPVRLIKLILVFKVLRFFGGGWKPVVVFGWKPSLGDDTESIDSGLSGVSDCMTVCFFGCSPVGVAGADELPKPFTALDSSTMVTNANYGWTKLR